MAFVIYEHMPLDSWWLDPDFYGRQKQEQPRMQMSRYGQAQSLIYGPTGPMRPKPENRLYEEPI